MLVKFDGPFGLRCNLGLLIGITAVNFLVNHNLLLCNLHKTFRPCQHKTLRCSWEIFCNNANYDIIKTICYTPQFSCAIYFANKLRSGIQQFNATKSLPGI